MTDLDDAQDGHVWVLRVWYRAWTNSLGTYKEGVSIQSNKLHEEIAKRELTIRSTQLSDSIHKALMELRCPAESLFSSRASSTSSPRSPRAACWIGWTYSWAWCPRFDHLTFRPFRHYTCCWELCCLIHCLNPNNTIHERKPQSDSGK